MPYYKQDVKPDVFMTPADFSRASSDNKVINTLCNELNKSIVHVGILERYPDDANLLTSREVKIIARKKPRMFAPKRRLEIPGL